MPEVAFAPDVFTWPSDEPQLIGGRCSSCAAITFPVQPSCARCGSVDIDQHLLPRRGTLWTFTTQEFVPKSPPYAKQETEESFEPFAVGFVEFDGQARVAGRIDTDDLDSLAFGMEMEVVVVPFMDDANGNEVVTYAFRPVGEVARDVG